MMKCFLISFLLFFSVSISAQSWKELNSRFIDLYNTGEFKKAAPVGEKAILAAKKEFGINHANYAISLCNLASVYSETGEYKKAETLYLQAKDIQLKLLGAKHPDYAQTLNDLAFVYVKTKQYKKAEMLYLQAKQIRLQVPGENKEEYATTLNDLASLYIETKEYAKAEPLYLQAKQISEKTVGASDPEYITTIDNLAGLYERMGKNEKAEPFYLISYTFYKEHPGTDSADLADVLDKLASLYDRTGQYSKAETYYLQLSDLNKSRYGELSPEYATGINKLALVYSAMAQYEKAGPLYVQAITIRKKVLGQNHPDYATSINNLASHFLDIGEYEKAEPLYLQAIDIVQQGPDKSNTDYIRFLNNVAFLYMLMGKYDFAEPLFLNLKEAQRKVFGEKDPSYATSLSNLGTIYFKTGQFEKAETLFLQAKEIRKKAMGEEHPDFASSLVNLAVLYETKNLYRKAEALEVEAKEIYYKVYGEAHPDYANSVNNLALVYQDMGEYEKAGQLFRESAAIRKKILGENHPDYAVSLNNLAYCYADLGQYDTAEKYFIQTKELMKRTLGEDHPNYVVALNNLSELYIKTGQFKKAEPILLQAGKMVQQNMLNTFTVFSESEKNIYLKANMAVFENSNTILYRYKIVSPEMVVNNFNLQLVLKSVSLADTKNMMESLLNSPDSSIRKLFFVWMGNRNLLARQYSLPAASRRSDLEKIEEQAEAQEKELNRLSSEFRDQQSAFLVSIKDIQKKLQPGEAAIEFVRFQLYNKKWTDSIMYAAYVVTKTDSLPVFVPLCEEKQLEKYFALTGGIEAIKALYRSEITDESETGFISGDSLYALVWKPLLPFLKRIKKIDYSPAGLLYKIAFNALPVDDNELLIDKYELNQYTSVRQLVITKEKKNNRSIALFGDCIYAMDSIAIVKNIPARENANTLITATVSRAGNTAGWNSLPGTSAEIKDIALLFDKNKIATSSYTQLKATEEQFKSLSGNSPDILHLATHGFFLPDPEKKKQEGFPTDNRNAFTLADDPLLRSGIVLSGANRVWRGQSPVPGREDAIVTAYEIAQMDLSKTELVVLSACETALGDIKGNEGVFGLQRAFKLAGVKNMLLSLWKVPDAETAELMKTFYTYHLQGKTTREAFTAAQKDMRKKYRPYYWAAFVLIE
jgi:CHAT domain-containing protein/Flp pilus assembly protein TadD